MPLQSGMLLCGARTKQRNHEPCLNLAMTNGRCRIHGGKVPIKHGKRTLKSERQRKEKMRCKRDVREINAKIKGLLDGQKEG